MDVSHSEGDSITDARAGDADSTAEALQLLSTRASAVSIRDVQSSAGEIVFKTTVTHTVTYFVVGAAVFFLLDYPTLMAESVLGLSMRPLNSPLVSAGPLLQPLRGVLFGVVFYLLREPFFGKRRGWLVMWTVLVSIGIVGTFGAPPGSLEGLIYTVALSIHMKLLPETLLQSLLLSWVVFHWVNRPRRGWVTWTMVTSFVLVLLLDALGLIATLRG